MVTTNDEGLDKIGRLIRNHGEEARYRHVVLGLNYRMTEIAAVIGLNELSNLDQYLNRRRHCRRILREGIEKTDGLYPQKVREGANHSCSYFSLVMDLEEFKCTRDQFVEVIMAENIDWAMHYPVPLTK
jgi:perosamine synthetase